MSWKKVGITLVSKLSHTGGAYKVTIPKNVVNAYDLSSVEKIEIRIERVKRPPAAEETEA